MNNLNITGTSIEQMTSEYTKATDSKAKNEGSISFEDVLEGLKFSKHAVKRIDDRQINLSAEQNERLTKGVAKAESKGIKDSLVMVDDMAFIVNVPSQTVITAMDERETSDHIFTNIDGTVIA